MLNFFSSYNQTEVARFCLSLASLLRAGLPLLTSLEIIKNQITAKNFKLAIQQISENLAKGRTLSSALRDFKSIFAEVVINLVEAGESGGFLTDALQDAGRYLEESLNFKAKLKSILTYPAVVISTSFISLLLIIVFVFPNFASIFKDTNIPISSFTRLVLSISDYISRFWFRGLLIILGGVLSVSWLAVREKNRIYIEKLIFKLPVISEIMIGRETAKFSRVLGVLLSKGCRILIGLEVAGGVANSILFRKEIQRAKAKIEVGFKIAAAFTEAKILPRSFCEIVNVGSQTGNLDQVLIQAAAYFEGEVESALKKFIQVLEPVSTLTAGAVVGLMVFSLFMPLVDFIATFQ